MLAGVSAGDGVELLSDVARRPDKAIDWRLALRAFLSASRVSRYTYTYPNRRFPTRIGEVPGRRRRVSITQRKRRTLVGIDTSGSMSRGELEEIARQLRMLSEHAHLFIAECDAKIQRVYPFERELRYVHGRGGTDLRPLFAPELLAEHRAACVVYFTDGEGPCPAEPPPVPVLWVLTDGGTVECDWGERVWMGPRRE
jgi:predicted metal-dependent peptidase